MRSVPWFAPLTVLTGLLLLSACGGASPTATPTKAPPTAPSTAVVSPVPTLAPGTPLTLEISSISPNPARVGDQVTITFKSRPGALIGFEITAPKDQSVVQTAVTVGSDGTATYKQQVQGPKGTWQVDATAGASLQDLLRLQTAPTPGPNSASATFEVQ